jgi:hypothetical protein
MHVRFSANEVDKPYEAASAGNFMLDGTAAADAAERFAL